LIATSLIAFTLSWLVPPADTTVYRAEIESWRRERELRLKADGGWLTVAGLFWLKPGANRFGADKANDIVLPDHSSPPRAGSFVLKDGRVRIDVASSAVVTLGGQPIDKRELRSDTSGAPPDVIALGALTMQIIERSGRVGVRLKDMRAPARRDFKGLRWYPVAPAYRVTARFVPHTKPTTISVPDVLGGAESLPSPGSAWFELDGKSLRLDPVLEPGSAQLFFIFRDATSGKTTYGAGRFLYADPPADGRVVLDFNKAYAPPCAFTPYATCPLPPAENRLPIAVEAGELGAEH
jgi:uncharacterized protein (DUF1684 family)